MGGEEEEPSFPSNYVTLLQLKERWLQKNPPPHSQLNPNSNDEANRHRLINKLKPDPHSKTQADDADKDTGPSNSKPKASTARKPRSVAHQNPNGNATQLLEPQPVEEKRESRHTGWNRKPKDKTASVAQNVDASSHNDAPAPAAAVKEENVSEGTNIGGRSGRFQGNPKPKPPGPWKPPFGAKKGQTSLVWVKKGESPSSQPLEQEKELKQRKERESNRD